MIKLFDFIGLTFYCGLIFWLSHQPALPVPMLFSHQDKLHHATAYFIMAMLTWRALRHFLRQPIWIISLSIIFCSAYGLTDEWHQSFIDGRHADIKDWVADTFGASLALLILYKFSLRAKKLTN
ncbi:MAG: VanZ family protein [Methylococcales bacterium]|nr:VanZ family protein [Methylococcales bacterium]